MARRPYAAQQPTYLRTGQAAEILHVSPKTVARWIKEGKLPHRKTLGGHARLPEAEVRALVEANTVRLGRLHP